MSNALMRSRNQRMFPMRRSEMAGVMGALKLDAVR